MPYIGKSPQFGVRNRFVYVASSGDTSVSGADANGATLTFTDGAFVDVYLNGVLLKPTTDYNTSTANTIAGLSALNTSDEVTVVVYDVFAVSDTVSAASGGTFSGAVNAKKNVVTIDAATYTVSSGQSGSIFIFARAAGIVVTLPELTTAASGEQYTFIVGTTFSGAGQINTGATADLYSGFAYLFDPATAEDNNTFIPDQSNDDTIDLGSAAQGWLTGGMIKLTAQSATRWHCAAYLHGDGTLATPFE